VLPLVFALLANWKHQAYAFTQLPAEVLDASAVLRRLKRPGDRVIARKPQLAFHAGVESAPFPFADSLPDLARGAAAERARWLFFSWPEAETRPAFWFLLDTTGVVPGLTPRCVTSPHPSVLYEIGPEFGRVPAWFRNDTLRAWHTVTARLMVDARNPQLLASRAALARLTGKLDLARASVERALAVDPNLLEGLLELSAIASDMHDSSLEIGALERAVQAHPDSRDARVSLGWAYLEAGRTPDAASVWRGVVNGTSDVATLRRMSEVFRQVGDAASAAEAEDGLARLGAGR
jgi:tetratricopeptide (TPR) repeat protein